MATDAGSLNWLGAIAPVAVGVSVFVLGQVIQRFALEPIHEQRKLIGEVANLLLFYGNIEQVGMDAGSGHTVHYPEEPPVASKTLRGLAGRLRATLWTIPFYGIWAGLRVVPSRGAILEASSGLVGWSNSLYSGRAEEARAKVAKAIRLPSDD